MVKKPSTNIVESAVPKSNAMKRLSDGERKALEKGGLAEHAHGTERENLLDEARRAAPNKSPR